MFGAAPGRANPDAPRESSDRSTSLRSTHAAEGGARATRGAAASSAQTANVINIGLWGLRPTWDNAEQLLHRLWGQAKSGEYRKDEWAAFQSLLTRLRYGG